MPLKAATQPEVDDQKIKHQSNQTPCWTWRPGAEVYFRGCGKTESLEKKRDIITLYYASERTPVFLSVRTKHPQPNPIPGEAFFSDGTVWMDVLVTLPSFAADLGVTV